MRITGHRGCRSHFPENTLAAVRGAAPYVDMIEVDVQRCASGELVVFHDEKLDEITESSGNVRSHTYRELSSLTVGGSEEPIPRLSDVLETLPEGTGINVELKHTGMHEAVVSQVSNLDCDVVVSSFHTDVTAAFRDESIPTAHAFVDSFEANLRIASELDCRYIHPHLSITDRDAVVQAHERGIEVEPWTVPDPKEVARLRECGVDGVIVDSWKIVPS